MGATGYGASRSWDSLLKGFATFSKMEMQLSPFLVCNFRYFYYATNRHWTDKSVAGCVLEILSHDQFEQNGRKINYRSTHYDNI